MIFIHHADSNRLFRVKATREEFISRTEQLYNNAFGHIKTVTQQEIITQMKNHLLKPWTVYFEEDGDVNTIELDEVPFFDRPTD